MKSVKFGKKDNEQIIDSLMTNKMSALCCVTIFRHIPSVKLVMAIWLSVQFIQCFQIDKKKKEVYTV